MNKVAIEAGGTLLEHVKYIKIKLKKQNLLRIQQQVEVNEEPELNEDLGMTYIKRTLYGYYSS